MTTKEVKKEDVLKKAQELNLQRGYDNEFAYSSAAAYNTWASCPANDAEVERNAEGEVPIHYVKVEDLGREWIAGIVYYMRFSAWREPDGSAYLMGHWTRRELREHARRLEQFGFWRYGKKGFPIFDYTHWDDDPVPSVPAEVLKAGTWRSLGAMPGSTKPR
jgi:hypothetical protein